MTTGGGSGRGTSSEALSEGLQTCSGEGIMIIRNHHVYSLISLPLPLLVTQSLHSVSVALCVLLDVWLFNLQSFACFRLQHSLALHKQCARVCLCETSKGTQQTREVQRPAGCLSSAAQSQPEESCTALVKAMIHFILRKS